MVHVDGALFVFFFRSEVVDSVLADGVAVLAVEVGQGDKTVRIGVVVDAQGDAPLGHVEAAGVYASILPDHNHAHLVVEAAGPVSLEAFGHGVGLAVFFGEHGFQVGVVIVESVPLVVHCKGHRDARHEVLAAECGDIERAVLEPGKVAAQDGASLLAVAFHKFGDDAAFLGVFESLAFQTADEEVERAVKGHVFEFQVRACGHLRFVAGDGFGVVGAWLDWFSGFRAVGFRFRGRTTCEPSDGIVANAFLRIG